MANILIIGDSWGQSPFWSPMNHKQKESYIEFRLFELGHTVWNRSVGGNQNLSALRDCDFFLRNVYKNTNLRFDLIIWFHTEMVRDMMTYEIAAKNNDIDLDLDMNERINYVKDITYRTAANLKNDFPGPRWAIIGGHAPLMNMEELSWADFLVEDWRSEILGKKMPECQTLSGLAWLNQNISRFGADQVKAEIDKYELILATCSEDKTKFYDGIHPTGPEHTKLAERIHAHFF